LRFKIRNALQCGLSWLIGQDALDFASESDVHLLRAVLHILQVCYYILLPLVYMLTGILFRKFDFDGNSELIKFIGNSGAFNLKISFKHKL